PEERPIILGQNDSVLYKGVPGSFQPIAREYDEAPGLEEVRWAGFREIWMNESGHVLTHVLLTGLNMSLSENEGIALDTTDLLELIIREGDPVPGLP
ncbi:MAG: hypothetical protein GWM98_09465, partial [Nitrospinaceae bacterium]|nr:hypothetical protein [Nitrospinaceae bacterium]NIR54680.1 hypothetical protein [Nitrospinaceae bacterium]NIS85097.1 hypothetical protein [Nitrospinaceae bacterium]NIT81914.1 hypothetical protein [Nitrospinaceae bacterium]NIU44178.1 hypothetical protein [Nitrospinaceae bacterium]